MQITWQRMTNQRQKCEGAWIKCHKHVTTMTLQSAQNNGGSTSASNWKATITVNGHKLQVVDNFTYLSRAVQIDDEVVGRTAKASVVLVDFVQMSGSEMESDFTLI